VGGDHGRDRPADGQQGAGQGVAVDQVDLDLRKDPGRGGRVQHLGDGLAQPDARRLGEGGDEVGRGPVPAGPDQGDPVPPGHQPVDQPGADRLDAAIALWRHLEPRRGDHGDPEKSRAELSDPLPFPPAANTS
jgi:hypothetical protein